MENYKKSFSLKLHDTLSDFSLQALAMSQKTQQAKKETAELQLKLWSTEKHLQGTQHKKEPDDQERPGTRKRGVGCCSSQAKAASNSIRRGSQVSAGSSRIGGL
jgi:hypothetical protein